MLLLMRFSEVRFATAGEIQESQMVTSRAVGIAAPKQPAHAGAFRDRSTERVSVLAIGGVPTDDNGFAAPPIPTLIEP